MPGGEPPNASSHKPPFSSFPSAAASSHRKPRWSSKPNNSSNNPSSSDHKTGDKRPSGPNPPAKPSPSQTRYPVDQVPQAGPPPQFPFPDPAALGPAPPPAYGFHMLDRRSIVLADGSVRSYFALPLDYQDFGPPPPRAGDPAANRFLGPEFGRFPPQLSPDRFRDGWNRMDGPMKRKYEEQKDRRGEKDEIMRQKHQLMQYGNPSGHRFEMDRRGEFFAGTSRSVGQDSRPTKHMRVGGGGHESGALKHFGVDQAALKKAFLYFIKAIYENPMQRKNYLENGKKGRIQCLVCGRSSRDFEDMHGLIMHTYNSDNVDLRVDHLGLHKALCVLMGWNYAKPPDNSKAYQHLPADEAAANREDLIMWPPHVIVHNTSTGKGKDGRMEGYGNKFMDNKMRELGLIGGKAKSLFGREGHLGITLFRYSGDQDGLKDALKLSDYFERSNRGRKRWACIQPLTLNKDHDNNPNLVEVDERSGEKKRVLYGYIATILDLDKVDFDTKKKTAIESLREFRASSK